MSNTPWNDWPDGFDAAAKKDGAEFARLDKRIAELEGDLSVARLALKRIDEELVGSYGEIATMRAEEVRRILGNIAYIIKPVI